MSAKGLLGIAKKLMNLLAFRTHIRLCLGTTLIEIAV
jgi:hypothetical protein